MHLWKQKNHLAAEKIARENAKFFDETLKAFQEKLTQANEVADIGERYLALETVEQEIKTCVYALSYKITDQIEHLPKPPNRGSPAAILAWLGTSSGAITWAALHGGYTIGVGLAGFTGFFGGPVILGIFGGAATITWASKYNPQHSAKIMALVQKNKDVFLKSLEALLADIAVQKTSIEKDLPALSASPQFGTVCLHASPLTEIFKGAVTQRAEADARESLQQELTAAEAQADTGEQYLAYQALKQHLQNIQKEVSQKVEAQLKNAPDAQAVLAAMTSPADSGLAVAVKNITDGIRQREDIMMQDRLSDLAASPRFYEINRRFPEVEKAFALATTRENFAPRKVAKPAPRTP